MKKALTVGWLLAGVVACGGKTISDGSAGVTGATALAAPPPTCAAICNRLVSLCAESPNASCGSDCEGTKTKYAAACAPELDAFLKCMGTTHVECTPGEVVVIDCSDERVDLEHCGQ